MALREDKTINQLSTEFGVHPVAVGRRLERESQAAELRERKNRWLKRSSALSLEARRAVIHCPGELSVRRP
ncbi:hypothetical protein MAMT_02281 [Methylacidimicrobium tartarophylax]|uniref:Uncharacterized protein n=1 Tax=Methylacidimicrobium tartarophylax TaxID=1041768 RepID=A0A5E6MFR8_9BACT|nr:hypothetical protein MAMT_02281 [Methylacidimicrobium tartarophylax]